MSDIGEDDDEINNLDYFLSNGQRKSMRVFVTYRGERVSMDIPLGWRISRIKKSVISQFGIPQNQNVQLNDEARSRTALVIRYAGADMPDDWVLSDLGISPGVTLKAYMKSVMDPVLHFQLSYDGNQKISVMEKLKLSELKVDSLRSIASRLSGLPVSVFRLVGRDDREMFDCHSVDEYGIRPGDVIRIETWDGWNDLLKYSVSGDTDMVIERLCGDEDPVMKMFQIRVAMYLAAHFTHSDLATRLCKLGGRPDDPVGQHPLRQWQEVRHIDSIKAPVHESVESDDKPDVLRIFALWSPTCILARDGHNLQPLNIALRRGRKKCASFLLTKQWSRVSFGSSNNSIPLILFHKLKQWADGAKEKVSVRLGVEKSVRPIAVTRTFPLLGQGIYVDGYSPNQMQSLPRGPTKTSYFDPFLDYYYANLYGSNYVVNGHHLNNGGAFSRRPTESSLSGKLTPTSFEKEGVTFKLPVINQKYSSSRNSSIQSNANEKLFQSSSPVISLAKYPQTKIAKKPLKIPKKLTNVNNSNQASRDFDIPLPAKSINDTPRPHFISAINKHMGVHKDHSEDEDYNEEEEDETDEIMRTLAEYYGRRGYSPRQHAIECLKITSKLTEKSWLSQVRIAMRVSRESVRKSVSIN